MPKLLCIHLPTMRRVSPPNDAVLCLGNFDGVHLAHRHLLCTAKELRDISFPKAACGAFCFQIPSTDFLSPTPPAHLCTLEQKLQRFLECGMEYAFLADFSSVRDLSPEDFVQKILIEQCHCRGAVCGFNYRFGKHGTGTPAMLQALLKTPVEILGKIDVGGAAVSSTRIRNLLTEGSIEQANRLLTIPYGLTAPVLHGKALGRTWGFPTANQSFPDKMLIPRHGVYISSCTVDGITFGGISNIGRRPTVDHEARVNCETHLLDFSGDLYGQEITVSFLQFLRPEQKFESENALRRQIEQDLAKARAYFQKQA